MSEELESNCQDVNAELDGENECDKKNEHEISTRAIDSRTTGGPLLRLPRNSTDRSALRRRWWLKKKGKWGEDNRDDFEIDSAVVLDHELRELGHEYWDNGPSSCPALAAPDDEAGVCKEDLEFARQLLSRTDENGSPLLEIRDADGLRKLKWNASEDALGLVCWFQTLLPSGDCVDDCGEYKCDHEKSRDPVVVRTPQVKLLCGSWGTYDLIPGAQPDESGGGAHYRWVEDARPKKKYLWHTRKVGACAWVDLRCHEGRGVVVVTEGLKKGLVASQLGLSALVLGSVSQGGTGKQGRVENLISGGSGRYELTDELLAMLRGNRLLWAFDGDVVQKPQVRRSLAGSMVSAKANLGVAPEFVLFPVGKTKGALDSLLLANKGDAPLDVITPLIVSLESVDNLGPWLQGDRAADIVAIAWEYFLELQKRGLSKLSPEIALRAWVEKATHRERVEELLLPYDPDALRRRRRDDLQGFLAEKYVLVKLGEGASAVLSKAGPRLVKPIGEDKEQQALERECFHWFVDETGHEPEQVNFAEDVKRFRLRHRPQEVTPCSWPWDEGLTRWIMPEPRTGPFPTTEVILSRLREFDEDGQAVPLSAESRKATMAFIGGIFARQPSRQVAVCRGDGGNGKGTLARLVASAFGGLDGGHTVALAVGDQTFNRDRPFWAEPLVGKYLCVMLDTKRARVLEDERMRMLTGGDSLPVEMKGGAQFNAPNHTRWWLNSNHTMEITGQRADLSRVFPLLFANREGDTTTDRDFEKRVLSEIQEFMAACLTAYTEICPRGGDVALTPGLVRVREQMVSAGEAELEAFAERHLVFEPDAIMKGANLTTLLDQEAPRSWEKEQKRRFRQFLSRRIGDEKSHRTGKTTVWGWKGVRAKTLDDWGKS